MSGRILKKNKGDKLTPPFYRAIKLWIKNLTPRISRSTAKFIFFFFFFSNHLFVQENLNIICLSSDSDRFFQAHKSRVALGFFNLGI